MMPFCKVKKAMFAVLLELSIVPQAVIVNEPLTRFARSLIQSFQPPTATFEHSGEGRGRGHGRACQRYDICDMNRAF